MKFKSKPFKLRLIFFFILWMFLSFSFVIFSFGFSYLRSFSKSAEINPSNFIKQVYAGVKNPYRQRRLTFLILGLDQRPDDDSLLTDTIILASINVNTGDYLLFSIPRDLWLDQLKTKINALYYYGRKKDPNDGSKLVKEELEEIIGQPIDHVLVLKMSDLSGLIDLVGGVKIDVERSFTDNEFPKDDGSYQTMTVQFEAGEQIFNGEKALQYMRSRKSEDAIEGTDDARQKRQKKVILALKSNLFGSKKIFLNPEKMGLLYRFFTEEMEVYPKISTQKLASFWQVAFRLRKGEQDELEIPWREEEERKLLFSSKDPIHNTWILKPEDPSWQEIKDFYQNNLP